MPDTSMTFQACGRFAGRLAGAVRRRLRYVQSRLIGRDRRASAEAALAWLTRGEVDGGIPESAGDPAGCPAVTGACIETALEYGCRDEAERWARWLLSIQRPDGSVPDRAVAASSFRNTACAVRGFLAILDEMPELEEAARRACEHLHAWIDADGRLRPPSRDHRSNPGDPIPGKLPYLSPLSHAGHRWSVTEWAAAVERAVDRWAAEWGRESAQGPDEVCPCVRSLSACTFHVEQYLEHGRRCAATRLMERVGAAQRANGSVAERLTSGAVPSAGLAHAAVLWYRLGCRDQADRAMRCLERRQSRSGGFSGRWGWFVPARVRREDTWTAKHYLDAALLRVRTAFEAQWTLLPDGIDPADGRVQAVRRWLQALPPRAGVADVGCGKGRFLRHLIEWFPQARFTGIDLSQALLMALPEGVTACPGSLLRIPVPDASFDGAFAVESLEHALVPQRAIAELCRIVRPGGRVLVIDKHRAKQPLSECEPWERWFLPEELTAWLSRHCDEVTVERVSHLEGGGGTGLFLAASGRRRR